MEQQVYWIDKKPIDGKSSIMVNTTDKSYVNFGGINKNEKVFSTFRKLMETYGAWKETDRIVVMDRPMTYVPNKKDWYNLSFMTNIYDKYCKNQEVKFERQNNMCVEIKPNKTFYDKISSEIEQRYRNHEMTKMNEEFADVSEEIAKNLSDNIKKTKKPAYFNETDDKSIESLDSDSDMSEFESDEIVKKPIQSKIVKNNIKLIKKIKSETETETESDSEPEPVKKSKKIVKPVNKQETESESMTETESDFESDLDTETESDSEPEPEPVKKPKKIIKSEPLKKSNKAPSKKLTAVKKVNIDLSSEKLDSYIAKKIAKQPAKQPTKHSAKQPAKQLVKQPAKRGRPLGKGNSKK
jgi:hypothetical protein